MSSEGSNPDSGHKTFKYCAVQLNLLSLIKVTTVIGFCGGLSWALVVFVLDVANIIEATRFKNYWVNFIVFSIFGAFFGAASSVLGYPLYSWFCKKNHGQKLSGIFHDPHD
ncbi:MAG: hypothetical protein U9R74_08135 [Pseudomonadota bacterium]|nr:hypothetical protein [Pseudomonadota bacterium]